jgi:hypothetical protein
MYTVNNENNSAPAGNKYFGMLQVQVVCETGSRPVENAEVQVLDKNDPSRVLVNLITDISGKTMEIELPAPPIEYSLSPSANQPYAEYQLIINAPGLKTVIIDSAQLLPGIKTLQPVNMPRRKETDEAPETIVIGPHFLFGNYPAKIYEDEIKENLLTTDPVMIPETVTVHDGLPGDKEAKNYNMCYRDYIKNVASSRIYATWPKEAIYANILVILSFTLNRFYTGWYKNQGYDFTITSSTAYDQIWIRGRNIDTNISLAVDFIFNYFLSLPDIIQPILTQACAGDKEDCPGMLSLWGSKDLGAGSYEALDILRFYYGELIYINYTYNVENAALWPGTDLMEGSTSDDVKNIQNQLNILSRAYLDIPLTVADGIYGQSTIGVVSAFQSIFDHPVTGIVDVVTWYKISCAYARLTNASSLCGPDENG